MAQQVINIGTVPNDRTGDTWRAAMTKVNDNDTELFGIVSSSLNNRVFINQLSDLPDPIAGVISLADDTVYIFTEAIDLGSDRIAYGNTSEIVGLNSGVASITSSTAGALLTANIQTLRVSKITLTCPNGTLINHTGSAITGFVLNLVVSSSFTTAINFVNAGTGVLEKCSFFGGTDGFLFSGTGAGNIVMKDSRLTGFSGTGIDLGTAVVDTVVIENFIFSGLGGSISINGATASANVITRGAFFDCTFNGAGTSLVGIDVFDLKWTFNDNFGVQNSTADAGYSVAGNVIATVISTADTPVQVDIGTGATFYRDNRFTVATDGTTTSNGLETIQRSITYTVTADTAAGSNNDYSFYVAINGTIETGSRSSASLDSADPGRITVQFLAELDTNDTVDLFVETNNGHTTNITISDFTAVIH